MFKRLTLSLLTLAALQVAPSLLMAQEAVAAKPAPITYIATGVDLRKCAFPFCGGFFVKAVNQPLTQCADGTWQKTCHAVVLNTEALGWTDEQRSAFADPFGRGQALVQGRLAAGEVQGIKTPVLTVASAWQAQALSKPVGTFYAVKSTGIVCITTPCPSLAATRLNSKAAPTNPDLDLSRTGASDEQIQASGQALATTGILTAGTLVPSFSTDYTGKTRRGTRLIASEFYLPAKP